MQILKNWNIRNADPDLVADIAGRLKISRAAASVLVNRGITSVEQAQSFLHPDIADLSNPFLMPDMQEAVARIRRAVDSGEKILVYGDRDVDGVTSISVMVRTLKSLGADPLWYIPSDEGYGVHNEIVKRYAEEGVTLVITVDNGISAVEETEYARTLGVDMVITDHHEPPATGIPRAVAVVDPKRADSRYPFSDLAGCSVSFKVAEALMMSFGKYFNETLTVAAVAEEDGRLTEIAAVRILNGIATDRFAARADGDLRAALDGFRRFAGASRLVVYDARRVSVPLIAEVRRHTGTGLPNPVLDIRAVAERQLPDAGTSLRGLADALGLTDGSDGDAEGRALLTERVFGRLEGAVDLRMKFFRSGHLDVVTLGTIADIMPLVDENRTMVKHGLKRLGESRKTGVKAIFERCLSRSRSGAAGISAKTVSWNITPVLNAAGRRGRADLSARLLLTEDVHTADRLLDEIVQLNTERRELQAVNLEKFMPLLREQCDVEKDKIFLVTARGIEHGVTGIIASQIMRQYRRPTILLIIEGDEAMGAARSVEGFDIVAALGSMSDLLLKYGGHHQAAGLTVSVDRLDEFRRRLAEVAEREVSRDLLVPTVDIDTELDADELSLGLVGELDGMEPYGMGNPHPVFGLRNMRVRDFSRIGAAKNHLRMKVAGREGGQVFGAIGWGMGGLADELDGCPVVDMAVQLEVNVWQNRENLQLSIVDIRPHGQ